MPAWPRPRFSPASRNAALRETELVELSEDADLPPAFRASMHRVRGYAYAQLQRYDDAATEFERSIDAARAGDALYELALSLRAAEILRGASSDGGEAERLFEAMQVSTLPEVPTG